MTQKGRLSECNIYANPYSTVKPQPSAPPLTPRLSTETTLKKNRVGSERSTKSDVNLMNADVLESVEYIPLNHASLTMEHEKCHQPLNKFTCNPNNNKKVGEETKNKYTTNPYATLNKANEQLYETLNKSYPQNLDTHQILNNPTHITEAHQHMNASDLRYAGHATSNVTQGYVSLHEVLSDPYQDLQISGPQITHNETCDNRSDFYAIRKANYQPEDGKETSSSETYSLLNEIPQEFYQSLNKSDNSDNVRDDKTPNKISNYVTHEQHYDKVYQRLRNIKNPQENNHFLQDTHLQHIGKVDSVIVNFACPGLMNVELAPHENNYHELEAYE